MHTIYSRHFRRSYVKAPPHVRRMFHRKLAFLLQNIHHPSLHAKRYDETRGIWQARVDGGWRFYFAIEDDAIHLHDLTPHPK